MRMSNINLVYAILNKISIKFIWGFLSFTETADFSQHF